MIHVFRDMGDTRPVTPCETQELAEDWAWLAGHEGHARGFPRGVSDRSGCELEKRREAADRRLVVARMKRQGMTNVAIARALGVPNQRIDNDASYLRARGLI